jgi:hypothetical protein
MTAAIFFQALDEVLHGRPPLVERIEVPVYGGTIANWGRL